MFKRKKKIEEEYQQPDKKIILTEYVAELKRLGFSNEQIKKKFEEKNYPSEFMEWLLQLNAPKEEKMAKEIVEEDEEEFEDDEVEEEDEEEVVQPVKKKKVVKEQPVVKKEVQEEAQLTQEQQILVNLAGRVEAIEATLYRMRNI